MRAELVAEEAALEPFRAGWDSLAVERARPFCAPAWMLAWWRHSAPRDAELRVVTVLDGDELVGLVPLFSERGRLRLLSVEAALGLEPLAREGREREVASEAAQALGGAGDLVELEGVRASAGWPHLLREGWAGRAWLHRELAVSSPTLALTGRTYEEWLASKSGHFRHQARRARRSLDEEGARFHLAETESELDRGLASFAALHHARWQPRGGSGVLSGSVERMLSEVARELAPQGRFRLWTIEVGEKVIAADVWLAAGGEVSWWLSGFDGAWGRANPTLQSLLAALEHAWATGDRRVDFGAGEQEVKSRLADGEDVLEWSVLVPPGPRYRRTRLALLPRQVRRAAGRRLPPGATARLKRLLRRA